MSLFRLRAARMAALSLAVTSAFPAVAEMPVTPPFVGGVLTFVGHAGVDLLTVTRRFALRVSSVGEPDAEGNIWSFEVDMTDLRPNEIRSWRLTFVSGELFAFVFQVRENEGTTVVVTSLDGPLNGISVGDGMLVEQMQVQRPVPQMQGAT